MNKLKSFKIERLDPISPTFCAAKWRWSDFYLHTGTTSSCHLPLPDKIDFDKVNVDIHYFNNTEEKLEQRKLMLEGKQPSKCNNCWQVEQNSPDALSERVLYSNNFKDEDFTLLGVDRTIAPRYITVSFDILCNFVCSYCDASQSTSWRSDILKNGPYKRIKGDNRQTYQRLGKSQEVLDYNNVFEKFYCYIVECLPQIDILHCLGGEPLISPNFWTFLERIVKHDTSQLTLRVVTNLSNREKLEKLFTFNSRFKNIEVIASIDNAGKSAEFLRKGLNWKEFEQNLDYVMNSGTNIKLISTIPGAALDNLITFLNWFLDKKKGTALELSLYRLRHPNFQAIQILPNI